jgi:hypothetical protein
MHSISAVSKCDSCGDTPPVGAADSDFDSAFQASSTRVENVLIKGINEEYLSDVCGKVAQRITTSLGGTARC